MVKFKEFEAMAQFKENQISENELVKAYEKYKKEINTEAMEPAIESARSAKAAYINAINELKTLEAEYDKLADVVEMKEIHDRRRGYEDANTVRTFNYRYMDGDVLITDDELFQLTNK